MHTNAFKTSGHPFQTSWTISGLQKGLLTCVSISPSGLWIVSTAQDSTVLFANFKSGAPVGILDIGTRFFVNTIKWRTDSDLYAGCSNGVVYQIDYNPDQIDRPLIVRIIARMTVPVREIALDNFRGVLAVACGGNVYVLSHSSGDKKEWAQVDHIPEPCKGPQGVVTGMSFYGSHLGYRPLLIGHAMSGWRVWYKPREYRLLSHPVDSDRCTIGHIAISSDESFLAVATLKHSVVTYQLSEEGPILGTKTEVGGQESTEYRHIVPVALTSNNLILRGTTSEGIVYMYDPQIGTSASLTHGSFKAIRALATHGNKFLVGSTDISGDINAGCTIRCYLSLLNEQQDKTYPDVSSSYFRIGWDEIRPPDDKISSVELIHSLTFAQTYRYTINIGLALCIAALAGFILSPSMDLQPPQSDTVSTKELSVMLNRFEPKLSQNPTLRQLLFHFGWLTVRQATSWLAGSVLFIWSIFVFGINAIPVVTRTYTSICPPTGNDAVSLLFINFRADIEAKIHALLACGTKAELQVAVGVLVALFKGCSDELLKIGAGVTIDVEAKASIVACVCSIITLLVEVLVQVAAKLGIWVVIGLFAKIDICLKLLLVNLNICIGGILVLIVKGLGAATIGLVGQIHLGGCFGLLSMAGSGLGISL
ncbi:transmembrane protein [Ceratobasidium sp. AG-Ba]|nr:transmembrane protein [Ceratobasidium sp. AG-Ba]